MTYENRNLARLREARFPSQADAAAAVGVSQATLSRWETGEAEPSGEYRTAYANALGIQVAELGRIVYADPASAPRPPAPKRPRRGKGLVKPATKAKG